MNALDERYPGFANGAANWRAQRDFDRVLIGALYLSHPEATTRGVSRLLGYRSAEALCHAFAHHGLPSPGSIHDALGRLER